MITVAITGSIGSGKSTVTEYLSERYYTQSCDAINAEILMKSQEVKEAFCDCLVDGEIDRGLVSNRIFNCAEDRKLLESILHPLILKEIQKNLKAHSVDELCFVEVPLLFEAGWQKYFDQSLLIVCPEEKLIRRLMYGRHMKKKEILRRLSTQMPIEEKLSLADDVIINDGSRKELQDKVDEYLCQICGK